MKRIETAFILFLATGGTVFAHNSYQLDPAHSSARFAVKHMMVSHVPGEFQKVSGTASYDPKNPSFDKLEATVELNSVTTNQAQRDADLKSPNLFDVTKFPAMTFRSTRIEKRGDQLIAIGALSLHGVTKPLTLHIDRITPEVKDSYGMMRFGAHASGTLNPKDYGITLNQMLDNGGAVVGDEINIELDAELVRPPQRSSLLEQHRQPTAFSH